MRSFSTPTSGAPTAAKSSIRISPEGSSLGCAFAHAFKAARLQPLGHLSRRECCFWNYN